MQTSDPTRLRALCERAALPVCEARLLRDDGAWCVVVPQGESFCAVVAELSWSGVEPFGGEDVTKARAQLYAEAPAAILGLCDEIARVTAERDALLALAPHPSKRTGLRCVRCGRDGGVGCGDDAPVCDVCDGAVAMEVERDALLALCERFGGEEGVICNGYEDDSGCGGCGANANHSDGDPANHAPDCVRLAARVLAAKIRARGEGGQ